jgi:hypothetical protein
MQNIKIQIYLVFNISVMMFIIDIKEEINVKNRNSTSEVR